MEKKKKHSFKAHRRAFAIWQKLGYLPWRKKKEKKEHKKTRDFYRGALDTIPFLNDDAKRTFAQLLLRPGYMIRDYIQGAHERYLAPLTALIVFYAFFALVAAVLQPIQRPAKSPFHIQIEQIELDGEEQQENMTLLRRTLAMVDKGWIYLHLDQFPDEVDTPHETYIAALERALRNQGIPLFLGKFFLLWLAMSWALRRRKIKMSATAAASAYVLCQFSFFMLFALLLSRGESAEIGALLILILLAWDYHQWLGVSKKKSFWLAVSTSIRYGLIFLAVIVLVYGASFLIARTGA